MSQRSRRKRSKADEASTDSSGADTGTNSSSSSDYDAALSEAESSGAESVTEHIKVLAVDTPSGHGGGCDDDSSSVASTASASARKKKARASVATTPDIRKPEDRQKLRSELPVEIQAHGIDLTSSVPYLLAAQHQQSIDKVSARFQEILDNILASHPADAVAKSVDIQHSLKSTRDICRTISRDLAQVRSELADLWRRDEVVMQAYKRNQQNLVAHLRRERSFNPNFSWGLGPALPSSMLRRKPVSATATPAVAPLDAATTVPEDSDSDTSSVTSAASTVSSASSTASWSTSSSSSAPSSRKRPGTPGGGGKKGQSKAAAAAAAAATTGGGSVTLITTPLFVM